MIPALEAQVPPNDPAAVALRDQWDAADDIVREWEAGAAPDAEEALRRGDRDSWDKSVVLHLAIREFHLRKRAGESLDARSFCRKFPAYSNSLALCLEARDALAPLLSPPEWPQSGDVCSGLQVLEELGRGAFARAYLARDPACGGRLTVLKLSQDGGREAGTLGKLAHENIVAVLGAEDCPDRGLSGLTTLFHGRATLCDLLDAAFAPSTPPLRGDVVMRALQRTQATLPPELPAEEPHRRLSRGSYETAVLHLARQICAALQAAHDRHVLHLDLKPSNVLLTPAGRPMLLDFNLSRDDAQPRGPLGGTLPYMSPEQLRQTALHEPAKVDARADIFSLGALLHQLLCGQLPFDLLPGDVAPSTQAKHLLSRQQAGRNEPPPPMRISRGVRKIIDRCLACDPAERFQSAKELGEALDAELSSVGVVRRAAGLHPRRSFAAASVVLLACLALGAAQGFRDDPAERLRKTGQEQLKAMNYAAAAASFDASLSERPGHVETLFLRGLTYQRAGEIRKALDDFEDAVRLSPHDPRILACRAYCLMCNGSVEISAKFFQEAIANGLDTAAANYDLGYVHLQRGRSNDALRHFDRALALDGSLSQAWHARAVVQLQLAQQAAAANERDLHLAEGLHDIRQTIALGPDRGDKHFLQANLLNAGIDPKQPNPATLDALFEQLNLAVDHGCDLRSRYADPGFAYLAGDPRYTAVFTRPVKNAASAKDARLLDPLPDYPR